MFALTYAIFRAGEPGASLLADALLVRLLTKIPTCLAAALHGGRGISTLGVLRMRKAVFIIAASLLFPVHAEAHHHRPLHRIHHFGAVSRIQSSPPAANFGFERTPETYNSSVVWVRRFSLRARGKTKENFRTTRLAMDSLAGDERIVGRRPAGCPHAFCGCEASIYLFGHIIPELNLAANWRRFPRAAPSPGMAAVRSGHVMILERHVGGDIWYVHDGNSGGHVTREHPRSIAGYTIVDPGSGSTAIRFTSLGRTSSFHHWAGRAMSSRL